MKETDALELTRHAIFIAMQLSLPILTVSLIIGVVVSLFQAVTQIQEQTLTFVPKVVIIALTLIAVGPWMLHTLVGYTADLIHSLPTTIH